MKLKLFTMAAFTLMLGLMSCGGQQAAEEVVMNLDENGALPRGESDEKLDGAFQNFLTAVQEDSLDLHSVMVIKHGKVLKEQWLSEGAADKPHIMYSVSKTFNATAVGFAISEGLVKLDDKVMDLFPEDCPEQVDPNMQKVTVKDLLTMDVGVEVDPFFTATKDTTVTWEKAFLSLEVQHEPGTWYCYNNLASYMLSAIVQKVTGQKVVDYLQTRLFEPLHIDAPHWDEHNGVNVGAIGLYVKTEDMAKLGQLYLQNGKWNGEQLLPEGWVEEASAKHVPCCPAYTRPDEIEKNGYTLENNDYVQGYGYQLWRTRHNSYRADGYQGQFIMIFPELDALIITTAKVKENQDLLDDIIEHLYPGIL